jgi:ubiquinol-cytochrome c reductase cytochrome c subunit
MRTSFLAMLILAAPSLLAQTAVQQSEPPPGDAGNGKKLYETRGCYQCHNYAANGGGAGPRLAPRPIPYAAFSTYVREPKGQMPPYTEKVLTDREIVDIYAFLRSIPDPPAVDTIPILRQD